MKFINLPLFFSLILSLAILTACGGAEPAAEVQEITPFPTPTALPPTPVPVDLEPTVTPDDMPILPAPAYYLNEEGQIMRLQQDGLSEVRITDEARPIDSFDVFGEEGRIVFVSDNKLIEFDAEGNRIVKVEGEPLNPDDFSARLNREIINPIYSPDGTKIAFGLSGINIISSGNATHYDQLVQSDPLPGPQEVPEEQPIFYNLPISWAPDGTQLLIQASYWPEAGGLVLLDADSGAITLLTSSTDAFVRCCEFAWASDSRFGVIASNLIVYGEPGISIVDATTGEVETVISGRADSGPNAESPILLLRGPNIDDAGRVRAFAFAWSGEGEPEEAYQIAEIDLNAGSTTTLNQWEFSGRGNIAWAPDGSGALIVDGRKDRYPTVGPLVWIPSDGSTVTELAAVGRNLRWGVPGNLPSQVEVAATATPSNADLPESKPEQFTELTGQFALDLDVRIGGEDGFEAVEVLPLEASALEGEVDGALWAAYTTGSRVFDSEERGHIAAIYRQNDHGWELLAQRTLDDDADPDNLIYGPDYVSNFSLQQVSVTPNALWLSVDGARGRTAASSSCCASTVWI